MSFTKRDNQIVHASGPIEKGDATKFAAHAKETFSKCLALNDDRVRIAHGTWLLGPGTSHMSRSFKMSRHFEKPEEIRAKAEEAKRLMTDIVEILIGNAEERREFVFQHANTQE